MENQKKARYTEVQSQAPQDPTIGDEITEIYIRGYHAKDKVLLNLQTRHNIDAEHIVAVGGTTIRGKPYVEIFLKSAGIGVSELVGKKFYDESARVFESIDDILDDTKDRSTETHAMLYDVPYKIHNNKTVLKLLIGNSNALLKNKEIKRLEAVNDDSGMFNGRIRVVYDAETVKDLVSEVGLAGDMNWKEAHVSFIMETIAGKVCISISDTRANRKKLFYTTKFKFLTDDAIFKRELKQEDAIRNVGIQAEVVKKNKKKCIKCHLSKKVVAYCDRSKCLTICVRCGGCCESEGHCNKLQRDKKRQNRSELESLKRGWAAQANNYCNIRNIGFIILIFCVSRIFLLFFSRFPNHLAASKHQKKPHQPNNTLFHHQMHHYDQLESTPQNDQNNNQINFSIILMRQQVTRTILTAFEINYPNQLHPGLQSNVKMYLTVMTKPVQPKKSELKSNLNQKNNIHNKSHKIKSSQNIITFRRYFRYFSLSSTLRNSTTYKIF